MNKNSSQTSISNSLTRSYLILFLLLSLLFTIVLAILTFVSNKWIEPSALKDLPTAEQLINSDIHEIDVTSVVKKGGGAFVVFTDGRVISLGGIKLMEKDMITMEQWTDFLTKVLDPSERYRYSVAFNEKKDFWLVVGYPVSFRILVSFTSNSESLGFTKVIVYNVIFLLMLLYLLFLYAWLYAKHSSKFFVYPLQQLCKTVKRMTHGEYEIKHQEIFKGEFLLLEKDISLLASQLKEEKVLRETLEKNKKKMLLDIAHDLRNPLATIMGYAETLFNEDNLDVEQRKKYKEVIYRNSIRANSLMNDLFTYTKLDSPDFKANMEKGDICEFVREQVSSFLPNFEIAGISTNFEIPEKEILIMFDGKLLGRALANLFSNSVKYNTAGTKFEVELTEGSDYVQINVRDNGVGIGKDAVDAIFEPFVRADKARNSNTGGSGLGLAIFYTIIRLHGGSVELKTALGEGCMFIIKLKK